jgi:hypothetical protein
LLGRLGAITPVGVNVEIGPARTGHRRPAPDAG